MPPRQPVLMSIENPSGWKLDELSHQLWTEMVVYTATLANDHRPQVRAVLRNSQQIMGLLEQICALERSSLDRLDELGPSPAPPAKPRAPL